MQSTFDLFLVMWGILSLGFVVVFLFHHVAATLASFIPRPPVTLRDHADIGHA